MAKICKCPKCDGTNLIAFVPNPEYVAHRLVDGKWIYEPESSYDGDVLWWDQAKYYCEECGSRFVVRQNSIQ